MPICMTLWFTNYMYLKNRGCIYTVFQCKYNTAVFTNEDPPHARYVKPQHSLHATILLVPAAKAIRTGCEGNTSMCELRSSLNLRRPS